MTSVTDHDGSTNLAGEKRRGSSNKNSTKSHLRNRRGYTREKTNELQKALHKVNTYQELQMKECVHLMDQMQKKLSKFEENEKFNMKQADMYNDILIKFNSL